MRFFMTLIIVLLIGLPAFASDKPVWTDADGEAYMSEIDTPKEVMARAKTDAQNRAVEKAVGVFIRSHTLVSNSQLAEDLVYASVRGKIARVEPIREGWDRNDRNIYRVRLRALVEPVYPDKEQNISLKLSLSKSLLREGDEVKIFYGANSDCYVYIFSVAADGSVTLLLPNSMTRDNYLPHDKIFEFPPQGSQIHLKAMFLPDYKEKSAEERIKIIATRKKEDIVPLGFQEGMFKAYDSKSTGMISDLIKKLNQLEPADWAEATTAYRIER